MTDDTTEQRVSDFEGEARSIEKRLWPSAPSSTKGRHD